MKVTEVWLHSLPVFPEVTVPMSMKEVGGFIEKQVAYLSGKNAIKDHSLLCLHCCMQDLIFPYSDRKMAPAISW